MEITVGSFLHATRLPMAGAIMAASAVALLTASQMLVQRHGFALRAALVCALLRALSPEGLMPGPMTAIVMQGTLVSLAFLLSGSRAAVAGPVAGALAVLATQVQGLIVKTIAFGAELPELLLRLLERAERFLGLHPGQGWWAVGAYLALLATLGAAAGALGMIWGRAVREEVLRRQERPNIPPPPTDLEPAHGQPASGTDERADVRDSAIPTSRQRKAVRRWSPWVGALIAGPALSGSMVAVAISSAVALLYGVTVDRTTLHRIGRPAFWGVMIVVTSAAGLLLGDPQHEGIATGFSVEGLQAGVMMSLRAFSLVFAGVLLARSLSRERIIGLGRRVGLPHLDPAFRTALDTLPHVQRSLGEARKKHRTFQAPVLVLADLAMWVRYETARRAVLFGVTGRKGAGKTSLLRDLACEARRAGKNVGGFVQTADGHRDTHKQQERVERISAAGEPGESIGLGDRRPGKGFDFDDEAFETVAQWLQSAGERCDLLLVDELGLLEAKGLGHAWAVDRVRVEQPTLVLVAALRKDRLTRLARVFDLDSSHILDLDRETYDLEAWKQNVIARAEKRRTSSF
ncbi:DUF2478 domain-containing protein [bacterium]|nr:DUF2478 domain-containing protein [bacterium]